MRGLFTWPAVITSWSSRWEARHAPQVFNRTVGSDWNGHAKGTSAPQYSVWRRDDDLQKATDNGGAHLKVAGAGYSTADCSEWFKVRLLV